MYTCIEGGIKNELNVPTKSVERFINILSITEHTKLLWSEKLCKIGQIINLLNSIFSEAWIYTAKTQFQVSLEDSKLEYYTEEMQAI
jgi:hypothetical protein